MPSSSSSSSSSDTSKAAAIATVLYPADADFKLEYYLKSHMPMVMTKFKSHGMTGWKVTKLNGTASGGASPYSIQCELKFKKADGIPAALKEHGQEVMADIPNFSNKEPVIVLGDVVGKK